MKCEDLVGIKNNKKVCSAKNCDLIIYNIIGTRRKGWFVELNNLEFDAIGLFDEILISFVDIENNIKYSGMAIYTNSPFQKFDGMGQLNDEKQF